MLRDFFQWVVYSSANPSKFALTIKAGLALLVLLGLDPLISDQLANGVVQFVVYLGQIVANIGLIVGLVRKLWLTR